MLHTPITRYLIVGTVGISVGAIVIALFGVVEETTHDLESLLRLYKRPAFIAWFSLVAFVVGVVLMTVSSLNLG